MARRPIRSQQTDDEDVNVTPLLDIVFIMLIFFIVTSTFIKEPGPEVNRPEAATDSKIRLISVLVAITDEDEIWINQELVTLDQVRSKVKELRLETPKGAAVIQVDAKAKSGLWLDVFQAVKDAGITDVNVATV